MVDWEGTIWEGLRESCQLEGFGVGNVVRVHPLAALGIQAQIGLLQSQENDGSLE